MSFAPLDALDFRIVNALQIHPRISWADLSTILSTDATTLSRRWARLTERGLAWSGCFYMPIERQRRQPLSFVEISCEPGALDDVVRHLVELPRVFSLHGTSGDRQLYATIGDASIADIDRSVREQIATVAGVRETRVHYVRRMFQEGGQWRLSTLTEAQRAAIASVRPAAPPGLAAEPTDDQWRVLDALGDDVRLPLAGVQARVGGSLPATSRRVSALLGADWAHWRIEVAHRALGYECAVMLWLRAPQDKLEQIATSFRLVPDSRLIASVTGPANLVISLWIRDLDDLDALERRVARVFPQLTFTDVWVIPQVYKRAGSVLDSQGLHDHHVHFDDAASGGARPPSVE